MYQDSTGTGTAAAAAAAAAASSSSSSVPSMCTYHTDFRKAERIECEALLAQLKEDGSTTERLPLYPGASKESAFKFVGETVTFFCVTDFFQNSKYSKEVLEKQARTASQNKRRGGNGGSVAVPRKLR